MCMYAVEECVHASHQWISTQVDFTTACFLQFRDFFEVNIVLVPLLIILQQNSYACQDGWELRVCPFEGRKYPALATGFTRCFLCLGAQGWTACTGASCCPLLGASQQRGIRLYPKAGTLPHPFTPTLSQADKDISVSSFPSSLTLVCTLLLHNLNYNPIHAFLEEAPLNSLEPISNWVYIAWS